MCIFCQFGKFNKYEHNETAWEIANCLEYFLFYFY